MGIIEYKEGEHRANFIGLRVTVNVGGDYRQKYFNFKKAETDDDIKKLRKAAGDINTQWNMERTLIQSKKYIDSREKRRTSSAFTTGVSGVKMKFSYTIKHRGGKKKKYYTPYFVISGSQEGVRFNKTINIIRFGFDMAWFKAISYYADQKGIANYSHLLERKPPVEQFFIIHKYQQSTGHVIPLRRMPTELDISLATTNG